jgi:hypothetical protein
LQNRSESDGGLKSKKCNEELRAALEEGGVGEKPFEGFAPTGPANQTRPNRCIMPAAFNPGECRQFVQEFCLPQFTWRIAL